MLLNWGMHGCSSPYILLVTAKFGSMGRIVEGGVGSADKNSPRRAAIEKVQEDLRREYDYREKRKRELEFLETGGDPLEFFNDRNASTVSVQSTSLTDQPPDQLLTSEAKGSFALTASPHGDSVESSGILGANLCEPSSADNLMLFVAEHELSEGNRNSLPPSMSDVPLERLSQMDDHQRIRKQRDSATFDLPRKAYKRRNRSHPNRDGTRSRSTDVNPTCGRNTSSLPSYHGPTEVREIVSDADIQNLPSNCNSNPMIALEDTLHLTGLADVRETTELASGKLVETTMQPVVGSLYDASSGVAFETTPVDNCNPQSHSGAVDTPVHVNSDEGEAILTMEEVASTVIASLPSGPAAKIEKQSSSCQLNGFSSKRGDVMSNDCQNSNASCGIKGLDSMLSYSNTSLSINAVNDSEMSTKLRNDYSNGKIDFQNSVPDGMGILQGNESVKKKENDEAYQVFNQGESDLKNAVKGQLVGEGVEACESTRSESGRKTSTTFGRTLGLQNENPCNIRYLESKDASISDFHDVDTVRLGAQTFSGSDTTLVRKIDEDSILKEARIIEAKRKRISELSLTTSPKQICPKSQWDYVCEEMAWLANDFAQERAWKIAAAAQISVHAAFTGRLREQENCSRLDKDVACYLAKSVMDFWHSVGETKKEHEQQIQKDGALSVQAYAVRFMKYNNSNIAHQTEVPRTPDRLADIGVQGRPWEDNLTEDNLFYTIPPGAMETYRNSIELQISICERIGSNVQEEVETSACDAAVDTAYYEDEGETSTFDASIGFQGSKSSRLGQRRRKHSHAYRMRSCEVSSDILAMHYADNKALVPQTVFVAKRPGGSLNVSIPTKRVRTASRRVSSPFGTGAIGCIQVPSKTDASSGDTNSFQDDQSTIHGGSLVPNSVEIQSVGDFENQLTLDSADVSTKHIKKKKPKHLQSAAYESRWQVDSNFQNDQMDLPKKSHQLHANFSSGSLGHPLAKKPKTMQHSVDNSTPHGGSVPSPIASQMSNNPNQFIKMLGGRDRLRKPKAFKAAPGQLGSGSPWSLFEDQALVVLAHDLGPNWELVSDAINSTMQFKCIFRKAKECKERHNFLMDRTSRDGGDSAEDSVSSQPYPSTLPGIPKGSARQLFQRLQGPVEEDTIKSHFEKIIVIGKKQHYRKNQAANTYDLLEMSRGLVSSRKQDPKQMQQPHSSHTIALSQVLPNNLKGGHVLNPLDLCDALSSSDLIDYQGSNHFPTQGMVAPLHPASSASILQGSPSMILGSNFSSPPGSLISSVRDGRYGVPRSTLSADEQQRVQQYNQMMSCRNPLQPNISAPGGLPGSNHSAHLLPGGSGVGVVYGVNRNMPMTRNGFQGLNSPSIVNSGGMVSPGMSSANMHSSGAAAGQGSPMLRPRQSLHMMLPGLSQDSANQMLGPELQMQQGSSQGMPHYGGLSSPFHSQTSSPPVSSYSPHQPSHPVSPQQPQVLNPHHSHIPGQANTVLNSHSYTIRMVSDRQQQCLLQMQQQLQQPQFVPSSLPLVQSPAQLPVSSLQTSSQVQPQAGSPHVPLSPLATSSSVMPQHQQKHQTPSQGVVRNAQGSGSGSTNQTKQRLRQQQHFLQANRQHPQVRQQPQAQQPAKAAAKGVGRGNMMAHQSTSVDPPSVNGVSSSLGNQCLDKGEAAKHLGQNQSLYTGSAVHSVQSSKQHVSSQLSNASVPQQKMFPGQANSSMNHLHQLASYSDNSNHGHAPPVAPSLSAGNQPSSGATAGPYQQQAPSQRKLLNLNQSNLKGVIQPNWQIKSDQSNKVQARDSGVDQLPTFSSTEIDTMVTLPHSAKGTTNPGLVSPGSAYHCHVSEPSLDPLNAAMNSSISPQSSESASMMGQGPGQRSSCPRLPSIRHDTGAQWQQAAAPQHPNSPVAKPDQHPQLPPPPEAGYSSFCGKNGDLRSE